MAGQQVSGTVIDIFRQACADLGEMAKAAGAAPEALARQVLDALQDNGFGQYDGLIAMIASALGPEGVAHLKTLVEELGRMPVPVPPKSEWQAVGWGSGGTRYAHEMEERARQSMVAMALKDIADVQGDVDGFIAQYDPKTRKVPKVAAEIAQRLLAAGRGCACPAQHGRALLRHAQAQPSAGNPLRQNRRQLAGFHRRRPYQVLAPPFVSMTPRH